MTTLADLTGQLEKLRMARASGVRAVQHGDQRTEFKTDAEMASAIADIERQIAAIGGKPIRTVRIATAKGI